SRPRLIAFGVACWSFATALSGFSRGYLSLLAARASVGIGEAAYVTIAPSLLSDYFPARQRARVMAVFFCAIPVGSALGYVVGGLVDKHYGWRAAFFIAGIPGLILAALCLLLKDPPRGAEDDDGGAVVRHAGDSAATGDAAPSGPAKRAAQPSAPKNLKSTLSSLVRTLLTLMQNRPYVLTIVGYAAYTFAVGGLAFWMPAFLERVRGMPRSEATVSFGAIVVVTGFVGTFAGGWLGDYCVRYSRQAYLWLSGASTLIAAPCVWMALTVPSHTAYLAWMVAAQLFLFLSTGPINAAIVNLVSAAERATAIALGVFIIHLLGDVPSPFIIGALSKASALSEAVKIVPVAVIVGAVVWAWAARAQAAVDR
ncbi:MAG TPA: MFS transporter, partial [Steroidobacteraceae bacterium]|nr:MFS transporter [Steroidobacteraceae bacterium]